MLRCGIDLIEVSRVRAALERHGARLRQRVFTPAENAYCDSLLHPWPHFAVRFAAKEALFKSLPAGTLEALVWREIGVAHDEAGAPAFELHGETARRLADWQFSLSLSHVRDLAIAQV